MSVRIIDRTPMVDIAVKRNAGVFLRLVVDTIHSTANPKTPKKHGNLRQNVLKQVLGLNGKIVWRQKYARPQEAGRVGSSGAIVRQYTTPGTGPHFAENAVKTVVAQTAVIAKRAGLS